MSRRLGQRIAAGAVGLGVALLAWKLSGPTVPTSQPQQPSPVVVAAPDRGATVPSLSGPRPLPVARVVTATSVEIPALGVRSVLEPLAIGPSGTLNPPADYRQAGWYARGPVPGDRGPAVIAGHIDSTVGPAVFVRLASLQRGDLVLVHRSDGRTARFRVLSTRQYSKAAFPTAVVYGPTPLASLRLITCGGAYDHMAHRYPDDVVVFAEAV